MSNSVPKDDLTLREPGNRNGNKRHRKRKLRIQKKPRKSDAGQIEGQNGGEGAALKWRMQHHPLGDDSPALARTQINADQFDSNKNGDPNSSQATNQAGGPPSYPMRAADTIDALLKKGRIDEKAAASARKFEMMFQFASLNGYATRDIMAPPSSKGSNGGGTSIPHNVLTARDEVWRAMCALGGIGTPGANIVWDVLGLGMTIKAHAERCQFGAGRSLNPMTATGILVQSCFSLAAYFEN